LTTTNSNITWELVIHILDLVHKYLKLSTKIYWVQKYIIFSTKIYFRSSTKIY